MGMPYISKELQDVRDRRISDGPALTRDRQAFLPAAVDDALARGVSFILSRFRDGLWSDFSTNSSGESSTWVTGFVLISMKGLLPRRVGRLAVHRLIAHQHASGGWGFSPATPPDCDSTSHVIRALLDAPEDTEVPTTVVDKGVRFIMAHQSANGGYATYCSSSGLSRHRLNSQDMGYAGWMMSHTCVTAAVIDHVGTEIDRFIPKSYHNALVFLVDRQHLDGHWEAYWWRSDVIATAWAVMALATCPTFTRAHVIDSAIEYLNSQRLPMGAWSNGVDTGEPCLLSTATAARALAKFNSHHANIAQTVGWLLQAQNSDGSWPSHPSMQIPPPDIINPRAFRDWSIGSRGVGSVCCDAGRIYTTASVLASLRSLYISRESR